MQQEDIKRKAQKAQKELLESVLEFFKKYKDLPLGPSDVTRELDLFKGLNKETVEAYSFTGTHNDKIAQGFINELLNQKKIKRVKVLNKWMGYKYRKK